MFPKNSEGIPWKHDSIELYIGTYYLGSLELHQRNTIAGISIFGPKIACIILFNTPIYSWNWKKNIQKTKLPINFKT